MFIPFRRALVLSLTWGLLWWLPVDVRRSTATAATATWDGSINGLWASTSGADSNWSGGLGTNGRPLSGDSLVFTSATGIGGTTLTDDLMTPGTFNVAGITFNAGAPAYTINPSAPGNGFTLTGGITNNSTSLQTIQDSILMTAVRTITMTAGGGNVTLGGDISGTGGGLTASGSGVLTLSGNNSYTGATTVNGVTLNIGSNSALGSGTIAIANAAAALDAVGGDRTLPNGMSWGNSWAFVGTNNLNLSGTSSFAANRTITLNSATGKTLTLGTLSQTSDANRTLTIDGVGNTLNVGTFNLVATGATSRTQTLAGTANLTISGGIADGGSTAAQNLTLGSSYFGVMTLNGTNTYTGTTQINNATVILNGTMASTALLRVVGTSSGPSTFHLTGMVPTNPLPANLSELRLGQAGVGVGKLILGGASGPVNQTVLRLTETTGASSTGGNSVVGGANAMSTLTVNNSTTNDVFASRIGGDGVHENNLAITKAGSATWTLSAANTYSGPTSITGGTLAITGTGSINGTSGVTITNGAKLLYTSTAPMTPTIPVALTQGTLDGIGTVGAVSVADDATSLVANGNAGNGQLRMSALSFAGDATVDVRSFAATLSPGIIVQGPLTTTGANGTVTINPTTTSGGWVVGNNPLISFGSFNGSITDFTLGTINGSLAARQTGFGGLVNTGSSIALQVLGDLPKWTGLDSGNWVAGTTGSNGNWKLVTAGTTTDYIEGDQVVFDDSATSAVTLSGGTVAIDISAGNVNPTTTEFNHSTLNYTVNSSSGFGISGTGLLTKAGTGTLTLNTFNSHTGGTLFTGGTLILGTNNFNIGNLGNGPVSIAPGSPKTLDNTTGGLLVLSTTTQEWSDDFTFTGSNDLNMGTGAVALLGPSRTVTVNGSRLTVGGLNGGTGTALVVNGAGTLAIGNSTVGGLSGNGTITNNEAANATLTVFQNTDSTFHGALVDGTSNILGLTKRGGGKLTLTSPNSAFTGTTTLADGTLVLAHPDALGNAITHTARVNVTGDVSLVLATDVDTSYALGFGMGSGNVATIVSDRATPGPAIDRTMTTPAGLGTGTIHFTAGPNVTSGTGRITFEQFSLAAGSAGTTTVDPVGVNLTLGNISKTGSTPAQTLGLDGTSAGNEVVGNITNGNATISVTKSNTSTWTLSGTNTYTGTTVISGGTLVVGNGGSTGSLGTGAITNDATLNFNRSDTDLVVTAAIGGTGAVNQIGAGKTTLQGANTYSGPTTISSGTLAVTGSIASSPVSVQAGTLDGTGSVGPTTVSDNAAAAVANGNGGNAALTLSSLTFNGDGMVNVTKAINATPILVTNALSTSANGPVVINGAGTWTSGINNLIGFGSFNGSLSHFSVGNITGLTSRQTAGALSLNGNNIAINIIGQVVTWTGNDDGNWAAGLNGANKNWKVTAGPTDYLDGDEVLFDDTATGTTLIDLGSPVSPNSTVFNNNTKNYTISSASGFGILSGPLSKSGIGALTLNTANSHTLGTILTGGTLNLGNAAALGMGSLTIGPGQPKTLDNTSGGPLTLSGLTAQTWNDGFTFGGTNDLDMGSAAVALAPGALTVTLQNAGKLSVGTLGGASTVLTVQGPGTGGLAIPSSTLGGLAGSGTLENNAAANATLTIDQASNTTFSGVLRNSTIANALSLTKTGTGSLTLASANPYTGTTVISNGTIVASDPGALGTGLISFPGTSVGTLEIGLDPGSDLANQFAVNTGASIVLKSGRETPGPGTVHTLTNNVVGGSTITIAKGANVTSGTATLALTQLNMTAGTDNANTVLNPTDADVTVDKIVTGGSARPRTITFDGTGKGTVLNGLDGAIGTLSVVKSNTSTWTIAAGGNSSYTGGTTVTGGKLLVNNYTNTGGILVTNGGTLGGEGTIDTATSSANITVGAGGSLEPGNAGAGTLTFSAGAGTLDLTALSAGGLKFDLGAPATPGASDEILLISGTLDVGTLDFSDFAFTNLGGVAPGTYRLIDAPSFINGSIGTASGTSGGITGTISLENTTDFDVLLTVTSVGLSGDFNNDGKVNAADYVVWRKNPALFGGPAGYGLWRANFGNPPGAGSSMPGEGGAVPEPGTLGLLCIATLALAASRRRNR